MLCVECEKSVVSFCCVLCVVLYVLCEFSVCDYYLCVVVFERLCVSLLV